MRVVQRSSNDHTVIGRAIADKTVQARDPQLLKLPVPLPSVPVLTPLLSPVVGGSNKNSNSNPGTTTAATTAAAPAQTSPSSSGNGNQGTSGGDSGSTSSGTGSSSSPGGSTGDTSSPASGGTSSSGTTSGGTTGDGTTTPSDGNSAGGTTGGTTSSGGSGSTTGTTANNDTTIAGNPVTGSSATGGSSSSNSGGEASPGGVANAGDIPSGSGGTSGHSGSGSHSSGGPTSPSSTHGVAGGGTDPGNNGTPGSDPQNGGKDGLSGGAVAGIIIVLIILLLGAFVFVIRRRSSVRRRDQANRWWFSKKRISQTYGDRNSKEILASGLQSARSSFATTVDHSTSAHRSGSFIIPPLPPMIPPLPPMAEVGRANGAAPVLIMDFNPTNAQTDNRFSVGSGHSDNSQYLIVRHRDSMNPEVGTPMSVRPFSPSESFAFPKPPSPTGDRNSAYSRPSSSATLAMLKTPGLGSFQASSLNVRPTPALPTLILSPINNVTDPFSDDNPFLDPGASTSPTGSTGEFAEIEFIRRPFYPTLSDEIAVRPDDPVRVLQAFDDGWAVVEKIHPDEPRERGKELEASGGKGLIPIDCLREPGQDLTTFFAEKRVSSYADSVAGSLYNAV